MLCHLLNIMIEVLFKLQIPFIPKINLVVDNNAEPFRMSGLVNEGLNCVYELAVTV